MHRAGGESINEVFRRGVDVLGIGQGDADVVKADCIEDFQRLAHVYEVCGVMEIEE